MKTYEIHYSGVSGRRHFVEFFVVVMMVSFFIYSGSGYFEKPIRYTQHYLVEYHAGVFSRAVANINGSSKSSQRDVISVDGVKFYVNEYGWPAGTDGTRSPSISNQTAEECLQVWLSVFENPPNTVLKNDLYNKNAEYLVSLNKKVICRYQWLANQEGLYFIDYYVTNGTVTTVRSH